MRSEQLDDRWDMTAGCMHLYSIQTGGICYRRQTMGRFVSGISRQDDASESWRLGSVSCPRWRGADKRQAEAARMKVLKRDLRDE